MLGPWVRLAFQKQFGSSKGAAEWLGLSVTSVAVYGASSMMGLALLFSLSGQRTCLSRLVYIRYASLFSPRSGESARTLLRV